MPKRATSTSSDGPPSSLHFSRVNLALGGAGLLALVVGYWLLAGGSVTLAPLLLVLGYVVLLPLAIIA
ncbi:MAG: hypothetical protein RLN75_00335 [Longimicrobiales bacterium]